jgi:hypothetical protein
MSIRLFSLNSLRRKPCAGLHSKASCPASSRYSNSDLSLSDTRSRISPKIDQPRHAFITMQERLKLGRRRVFFGFTCSQNLGVSMTQLLIYLSPASLVDHMASLSNQNESRFTVCGRLSRPCSRPAIGCYVSRPRHVLPSCRQFGGQRSRVHGTVQKARSSRSFRAHSSPLPRHILPTNGPWSFRSLFTRAFVKVSLFVVLRLKPFSQSCLLLVFSIAR